MKCCVHCCHAPQLPRDTAFPLSPESPTTALYHGQAQAQCGGTRLMAGPKVWGRKEKWSASSSLLQFERWMFVTLSPSENLMKWSLLMALFSLGTVSALELG